MTTTTLRYNGRAFTYSPTSLVARDGEEQGTVYTKKHRMELSASDAGWGLRECAEKLNERAWQ